MECAAKETRQTLTLEKAQDIDLDTAYMEVRPWNQLEILCDESELLEESHVEVRRASLVHPASQDELRRAIPQD